MGVEWAANTHSTPPQTLTSTHIYWCSVPGFLLGAGDRQQATQDPLSQLLPGESLPPTQAAHLTSPSPDSVGVTVSPPALTLHLTFIQDIQAQTFLQPKVEQLPPSTAAGFKGLHLWRLSPAQGSSL